MDRWEELSLWVAIALFVVAFASFLFSHVFRKGRFIDAGSLVFCGAFLFHTLAVLARWRVTGHLPVMHTYENSLIGTWFLGLIYIALGLTFPSVKGFGVIIAPFVLLVLGNGILVGAELQPLEPAFRSNWLFVHVLFAWLTFGSYLIAFTDGALYLLREKGVRIPVFHIPEQKLLEELSLRLILFGFLAQTVMTASGAIWAHGLWGRYWGWDPVETWSLISWLVYGLNLHLRITFGWREKRAAWMAVVSLVGIIFLFFGFGHGSSVHTAMFSQ